MTTVMIVDDDWSAQRQLKDMLENYGDFEVVHKAGTVAEAERILSSASVDLLFLDYELPDGSGLEFIKFVHEHHPEMYVVIFTAFYQGVGGTAYQQGENDYLLKPIVADELDKVIRRYQVFSKHDSKPAAAPRNGFLYDTVALTTMHNELRPTRCEDIYYFRYNGERKLWTAVLNDASQLSLRKGTTAKDVMKLSPLFQQCHQSFIVNLRHVQSISNSQLHLTEPFSQLDIPMGRTYLKAFIERFHRV